MPKHTTISLPWPMLVAPATVIWSFMSNIIHERPAYEILITACCAQVLAWFIWTTFIYPHFLSPLRHLPTPEGNHWLWGHGMKLLREQQGHPSKEWLTEVPHDGIIRYLTFFNRERLIVYSPKALADIFVTNCYVFRKPAFLADPMRIILGNGLLLSEGEDHKIQKKDLLPAFTRQRINALFPIFCDKAYETVLAMSAEFPGDEARQLVIANWASRYALDVIGKAGLGKDFGAIHDVTNPLVKTYNAVFKVSKQQRLIFLLRGFLPRWLVENIPIKHNRDHAQAAQVIRQVCQDIIADKRASFAKGVLPATDILSTAIQSGHFSDDELVDQAMTFLAAGHETTESSIIWAIYILSCHADIQQKLRAEIHQNLPSIGSGGQVTSDDINRLPFLHAVCNETLRIFSPVRLTMREASENTLLQNVPIPRGTKVMISSTATNMDKKLWGPDATEFNPYRWLTKNDDGGWDVVNGGGALSNYAMLTFSQGRRSCIGQSFARAEFACLLAAWIARFEFWHNDPENMSIDKIEIGDGITAKPANGMRLFVRKIPGY